jgi:hypothetical protein
MLRYPSDSAIRLDGIRRTSAVFVCYTIGAVELDRSFFENAFPVRGGIADERESCARTSVQFSRVFESRYVVRA